MYDKAVAQLSNQIHVEWRDVTWAFLTRHQRAYYEDQLDHLRDVFEKTVEAVDVLEDHIRKNQYLVLEEQSQMMEEVRELLETHHEEILNNTAEINDVRYFYQDVLGRLQNQLFSLYREQDAEDAHWEKLVALETLLQARNSLGTEHYLGQIFYYGDSFDVHDHNSFVGKIYVTNESIKIAQDHYAPIGSWYNVKFRFQFDLVDAIDLMTEEIKSFRDDATRPKVLWKARQWRDNITSYAEILEDIEFQVAEDIKEEISDEISNMAAEVGEQLDLKKICSPLLSCSCFWPPVACAL